MASTNGGQTSAARGGGRGRGRGRGESRGGGGGGGGGGSSGRGRGPKGRGRGGSNNNARNDAQTPSTGDGAAAAPPTQGDAPPPTSEGKAADGAPSTAEGDEVCFICADPIKFHSIAPCNHKTCHICGLRMRALYKTKDCAHCRTAAPFVIFTDDPMKRFEDYVDADFSTVDKNIGIRYTNEEIVEDTVVLLRYNCPAADCVFAGLGWPDLHRHVRSAHQSKMCDLCTRNKKVFTHEHDLFADKQLEKHMRHGDDQPGALDQTGFKGHPLCGFCGSRFYDADKLYDHCREKHERCFICDRRDSRHPHYYRDYQALEKHFGEDHFPCLDPECQERKFVVFESEMDLKAHQLSEHGNTLSKDIRRDARVVDLAGFDYRSSYTNERQGRGAGGAGSGAGGDGGGPNRRQGGRAGRGRGRDPNAEPIPQSSAQPLRRDELAYQRQMAIQSAQSVTNRTFGGQLSSAPDPTPAQATAPSTQARNGNTTANTSTTSVNDAAAAMGGLTVSDPANISPAERARLVRHSSVIERAANMLGHDEAKMGEFRQHISSYRRGGMTATQLIDGFFSLFTDTSSNAMGTLVREVAELFEDKTKAQGIQKAWQDWRAINDDYPSLPGLGGMQGGTSGSSSGWAAAAGNPTTSTQRQSNRLLRLKNSTRVPGPAPTPASAASKGWVAASSSSSSRQAAPTASAFPSLPPSAKNNTQSTGGGASSKPSWIGPNTHARPTGGGGGGGGGGSSRGNPQDNFPALPAAAKPTTTIFGYGNGRMVHRDWGNNANTGFSWGETSSGNATPAQEEEPSETTGGKKKGKGKGKKVLVQWG